VLEGLYRAGPAVAEERRLDPARAGKTAVLRPREDEPLQSVAVPGKTRRLDARKAARATAAGPAHAPAPQQKIAGAARPAAEKPAAAPTSPPNGGEAAHIRLNYNIVLTPADPAQRLLPEIASDLEGFVRSLIVGRGWRAQRITVRPDHCLISLSAPASSPPSDIIRVLRGETSAHILARLAPAGGPTSAADFWTATHLLTTQEQPPTPGQIANFIAQTRKSQTPPSAPAAG
jgi:REP element-mobilizing transposase RayT